MTKWFLPLLIGCFALGCSSDDDDDSGTGGSAGSAGSGGSAGSSGSGGSAGSAGSGGSAGSAGSASCVDSTNPMFGSCIEDFIASCWAPDLGGTCTDDSGTVSWSDGHKYVTSGNSPGMYGPGDTSPCIPIVTDAQGITATKGSETISYAPDSATETATITCPDGSTFTATFDQVTAFNRCVGLNCPL